MRVYENANSRIKIENTLTIQIGVKKGLRYGYSLSPFLFNKYLDITRNHWRTECNQTGVPIDGQALYTWHFMYHQVIFAQDIEDIENKFRKLNEEYNTWNLKVNFDKTQYLCFGGTEQWVEKKTIKSYLEFTYLEIRIRINTARCD